MTIHVSPSEISDIIGSIYDCAIEPALWPKALEKMASTIGATHGTVSVLDFKQHTIRFASQWNGDPYWMKLLMEKYAPLMPFYRMLPQMEVGDIMNTQLMMEKLGDPHARQSPFFTEWAYPAGYYDCAAGIIMRTDSQIGMFTLQTPDLVTAEELEIAKLFTPHIQRAITISDLLDMRSIAKKAFEETLDTLAIGVVLVDEHSRIQHSNAAAERMFAAGVPILRQNGELQAASLAATNALLSAIRRAASDEASMGVAGIGVPISTADGHYIAHVLPLRSGKLRPGLPFGAFAAVFMTPERQAALPASEALIALFELTPTEARVLLEIAGGSNRSETAAKLGIADSTVKTHLARIFEKTGTSEQSALTRLVANLTPPVAVHTN